MTKTNPLVSVIIPNYCHSRFLDLRIQTVLNQTYKNLEIIILDDCSPDNGASRLIIEKYRNNPLVSHIIYNEVNSGNTFLQWKKGIELCKGEIIWIAESDDFCECNMLEELIKAFFKYKDNVIAFTSYRLADENGPIKYKLFNDMMIKFQSLFIGTRYFSSREFNVKRQLLGNNIANASTAIFSREAYSKIEKNFVNYRSAGDYLFWTELSKYGSVVKIYKYLSYFRRHSDVVTSKSDANGMNFAANKEIMLEIKDRYKISSIRWKLAITHQKFRISKTSFYNKEISLQTISLWGDNKIAIFYKMLHKIYFYFVRVLDYYI